MKMFKELVRSTHSLKRVMGAVDPKKMKTWSCQAYTDKCILLFH